MFFFREEVITWNSWAFVELQVREFLVENVTLRTLIYVACTCNHISLSFIDKFNLVMNFYPAINSYFIPNTYLHYFIYNTEIWRAVVVKAYGSVYKPNERHLDLEFFDLEF